MRPGLRVGIIAASLLAGAACGGAARPADTTPPTGPGPEDEAGGDVVKVIITLDPGLAAIPTLAEASRSYGCGVEEGTEGGYPTVLADCADGVFGAVQRGVELTIMCSRMSEEGCQTFVLGILQQAGPSE